MTTAADRSCGRPAGRVHPKLHHQCHPPPPSPPLLLLLTHLAANTPNTHPQLTEFLAQ